LINVGAILYGGDFAVGRFDQVPFIFTIWIYLFILV